MLANQDKQTFTPDVLVQGEVKVISFSLPTGKSVSRGDLVAVSDTGEIGTVASANLTDGSLLGVIAETMDNQTGNAVNMPVYVGGTLVQSAVNLNSLDGVAATVALAKQGIYLTDFAGA